MKLEVIGTNSAFAKQGVTASLLLWRHNGEAVLMDCGYPVYQKLRERDYPARIKTVLLSHLHQDHCGSAVVLLEYRKQVLGEKTAIGGVDWKNLLQLCEGDLYADKITSIPEDLQIETWLVPHGKGMECRAMLVENTVLYSGDTAISLLNTPQAQKAKIIVHHAHLKGNPLHVSVAKLGDAAPEIKAKTWLSHYMPEDYEKLNEKCHEFGLAGILTAGKIFDLE